MQIFCKKGYNYENYTKRSSECDTKLTYVLIARHRRVWVCFRAESRAELARRYGRGLSKVGKGKYALRCSRKAGDI